ncbi:SusD family protein [Hymenobacter daecheongensis DSM 21074]|uniref:SusD family protein n=1 Tax=Hymenobacter daecheongensis DSM 21074 TaxID=1121955 RepID=A0A1M6C9J6_9BACT|nr:RagB/SusD family nutrient uptake outer membrane protein [Hymenobacter daecheongensis]SHI57697.1 SusD family protein [Hymenobacter daecheongensis DSM 21074]
MKLLTSFSRRPLAALALALLLGLMSCEKQLDIQPQQSVDAATALDSPEKVESAVIGAYARLDLPQLYGTNLLLLPDLLAADGYVNWQGTFQSYREVARRTMTSINTEADRTWNQAYQTINLVNLVLDAAPVVTNKDLRDQLTGEVRLIRGMLYFELVRLYAQQYQAGGANTQPGVPLALTANKTEAQAAVRLSRASVADVYKQILDDLNAANALLPESNGVRLDAFDAQAMLARVYLQQGNYAQALAFANGVIQDGTATLNPSVLSAFTNRGSREVLFEIQQNDQNNAGDSNDGLATFYSSNANGFGGRGDVQVLTAFAGQYGTTDQRGAQPGAAIGNALIYTGDGRRSGRLRSYKWNTSGQNIPIIRLAEMYLIRAEANVRLASSVGVTPLADINRLRTRAQATPLAAVTLADVLKERELELAFEGFRIHDLRRTGRPTGSFAFNDPKLLLPIPQYEINLGNALPQNPGY